MRTSRTTKSPQLCALLTLLAVGLTACGTDSAAIGVAPVDPVPRMRQVAEAWQGTPALAALREGFYPLERFRTAVPKGGLRSQADRTAHLKGAYVASKPLPGALPKGEARWQDGTRRAARALSAEQTVELLGEGDNPPDGGPTLKVTAARLGETQVATARGSARVPAWLFTVAGYDAPFAHPAVAWPKFPGSPVKPLPDSYETGSAATGGPDSVQVEGRTLTVSVSHGSCSGPAEVKALETGETIVLAASVRPLEREKGSDQVCDLAIHMSRATVRLNRPVGDRVLLEARRGTPVQQPAS